MDHDIVGAEAAPEVTAGMEHVCSVCTKHCAKDDRVKQGRRVQQPPRSDELPPYWLTSRIKIATRTRPQH
jgi:hypothetical protein